MSSEVTGVRVYRVPSETTDGVSYEVTLGEGFGRCTCPSFFWRFTWPTNHGDAPRAFGCKHLDGKFREWQRETAHELFAKYSPQPVTITVPAGTLVRFE